MRRWSYNIGNPHSVAGEIGVLDSLAVDAVIELVSRVRRRLFVDRRWSLGFAGAFGSSFPDRRGSWSSGLRERLVARLRSDQF